MRTFDLQARPHQAGTLMSWLAGRGPQALRRAGVEPVRAATEGGLQGLSPQQALELGIFGPVGTYSGMAVTEHTAMLVSTLYACLDRLAGAVIQLPLHQYRIDDDGNRERLPPTPLWWLLNESPSPAWTAAAWKEWIVRCCAMRGDQHTEILRQGPAVTGFKVHHPTNVQVRTVHGRLRYDVVDAETGRVYGVDQDDMLHFSSFGFDGERSPSVVQHAARNSIGNMLAASRYMGKTIGEGGMPQIALQYPNKVTREIAQDLRDSFVSIYGNGEGRKLPLIMSEGGEAKELSFKPIDLELLASRKLEKQDICDACGVPLVIVGDTDKASAWGTGIEQIIIAWVRFSIKPRLARWEEELNRKLFRRAGTFVEFQLDGLLRGDSKAQSEAFRAAIGGPGSGDGYMAVNEVRRLLNLKPFDGAEFDQPFRAQRGTATPPKPPEGPAP